MSTETWHIGDSMGDALCETPNEFNLQSIRNIRDALKRGILCEECHIEFTDRGGEL